MMNSEYPKILLLDHQFDNRTGLGITLANLFANWPQDKLAIMARMIDVNKCENSRPCKYYFGQHHTPSETFVRKGFKWRLRELIKKCYYYLGLNEIRHKFSYRKEDIEKAQSYNPDIIFCCLGTLNSMVDCEQVLSYFPKSRLVLYIVDDWVNTKENNRLFSKFWRKENDRHFRLLLNKAAGLLSICPYMSDVYKERYGKTFLPFHNPVDYDYWKDLPLKRKYGVGEKAVLYVGKINADTKQCLIDVATVIDSLNKRTEKKYKYILDVYTPDYLANQELFMANSSSHVMPAVPHDEIPLLMKGYDALLLTLGFSKQSKEYVRLSMPTKVSEYLASGIPTLLYCPEDIALARYLVPQNCTINCLERNISNLAGSLSMLENDDYCTKMVVGAMKIAKCHDANKVRDEFANSLRGFLK